MVPVRFWVDEREFFLPKNHSQVLGFENWSRAHSKFGGIDVLLWCQRLDHSCYIDVLSNNRVKSQKLEFEWIDGTKETVRISPYCGYGFPYVDYIEEPHQVSDSYGNPLGFYHVPQVSVQNVYSGIDITKQLSDFQIGNPRGLDQAIRKITFNIRTDARFDLGSAAPYGGDSSFANDLLMSLARFIDVIKWKQDLRHLNKFFTTILRSHCDKAMSFFGQRLDCKEILLPGLIEASNYYGGVDEFIKETRKQLDESRRTS